MKQGKTEKAVFAKLSKVELNTEKENQINLSSVDAMEAARKRVLNYISNSGDFQRKAEKVVKEGYSLRSKVQESMRDLEILIDDHKDVNSKAKTTLKEFASAAKQLGLKPQESKEYNQLQTAIEAMQGDVSSIKGSMKELRPFNK